MSIKSATVINNIYGKALAVGYGDPGDVVAAHVAATDTAELVNADLSNCDLAYARLTGGVFSGGDLSGSCFDSADLQQVIAFGVSFRQSTFQHADLRFATFEDSDFTDACLWRADLTGTNFKGCVGLTADQLREAQLGNIRAAVRSCLLTHGVTELRALQHASPDDSSAPEEHVVLIWMAAHALPAVEAVTAQWIEEFEEELVDAYFRDRQARAS